MKIKCLFVQMLALFIAFLMAVPPAVFAQDAGGKPAFKQEELDQIIAPIALYPDSLLTQVLMASTYPLDIVQADRWAQKNKSLKGDELAKALEAQAWDPSVKSLVNFPQVLTMMGEKIDWTQKLGNAFLAQQKDVMGTVQKLRAQAQAAGNLKTTKEQTIIIEKETKVIIIEPANPQVIYVPAYNPTVVYGTWAYPAYPPYPVYPPGYVAGAAFVTGVAVGAAWGYAWGHSNWHGGDVNINVNQNANINKNINRGKYATQYQGQTGKYNQVSTNKQVQARQDYRGRTGSAMTPQGQQQAQQRAQQTQQNPKQGQQQAQQRAQQTQQNPKQGQQKAQQAGQKNGGAFEGMNRSGSATRDSSSRGASSTKSMSSGSRGGRR